MIFALLYRAIVSHQFRISEITWSPKAARDSTGAAANRARSLSDEKYKTTYSGQGLVQLGCRIENLPVQLVEIRVEKSENESFPRTHIP